MKNIMNKIRIGFVGILSSALLVGIVTTPTIVTAADSQSGGRSEERR